MSLRFETLRHKTPDVPSALAGETQMRNHGLQMVDELRKSGDISEDRVFIVLITKAEPAHEPNLICVINEYLPYRSHLFFQLCLNDKSSFTPNINLTLLSLIDEDVRVKLCEENYDTKNSSDTIVGSWRKSDPPPPIKARNPLQIVVVLDDTKEAEDFFKILEKKEEINYDKTTKNGISYTHFENTAQIGIMGVPINTDIKTFVAKKTHEPANLFE